MSTAFGRRGMVRRRGGQLVDRGCVRRPGDRLARGRERGRTRARVCVRLGEAVRGSARREVTEGGARKPNAVTTAR